MTDGGHLLIMVPRIDVVMPATSKLLVPSSLRRNRQQVPIVLGLSVYHSEAHWIGGTERRIPTNPRCSPETTNQTKQLEGKSTRSPAPANYYTNKVRGLCTNCTLTVGPYV